MADLKEGQQAPDFSLKADDGNLYTLKSFTGKKLILYFYPKDNTPGCTTEAVDFTTLRNEYENKGYTIVGISPDSIESHEKFRKNHNLDILLLSDPDKKCAESYGAYGEKMNYGKTYLGIIRSTFIIDEDGLIIKAFKNVKAKGHANKVLCALK